MTPGFVTAGQNRGWPLAGRTSLWGHSRIDGAELTVTHVTRRTGRPYTLVLSKTEALFDAEREARAKDMASLAWLTEEWASPSSKR